MKTTPGIILAGGRSSRMGKNKSLLDLAGASLLRRAVERFEPQVSWMAINALPGWAEPFQLPVVPDTMPHHAGPLAGILAGLRYTAHREPDATHCATIATDTPFFPKDLVKRLSAATTSAADIIAVAAYDNALHPVFALWPVTLADDLENWLALPDNRRVKDFLARHKTAVVPFAAMEFSTLTLDPFFNINRASDLKKAERLLMLGEP